jgi:hypothetical protein
MAVVAKKPKRSCSLFKTGWLEWGRVASGFVQFLRLDGHWFMMRQITVLQIPGAGIDWLGFI